MSRLYCEHLTPIDETCPECEAMTTVQINTDEVILPSVLRAYSRELEREELVLKFMMAFVSRPMYYAALDDYVEGAVEFADAYLKWRNEERRK